MSTKNVKVAVPRRSRRKKVETVEETPTAASSSSAAYGSQKKVTEYFRTVHRDPSKKKYKRFKEVAKDVVPVGSTKVRFESPNKIRRLKSPQTSPVDKIQESNKEEWVLPETCPSDGKVVAVPEKVEDKEATSVGESACAKVQGVTKEDELTKSPLKRKLESTPEEEEQKKKLDDVKKSTAEMQAATEKEKELTVVLPESSKSSVSDTSNLSSAVKLVESIKNSTVSNLSEALPLPPKYERLLRLFDYTEVVVSWLETQGKRITLNEVMTNVQRKLKSNYGEQQFAQILSIYPESYKVNCERRWMPIGGRNCKPNEFEYVIEPNLVDDLDLPPEENDKKKVTPKSSPIKPSFGSPTRVSLISLTRNPMTSPKKSLSRIGMKSPIKSPSRSTTGLISSANSPGPSSPRKSPMKPIVTGCPPKLEGRRLLRKLEFKSRLRKLVNIQHTAFLKQEGIEISPDEQLPRYHPDFDLDAVDDIQPAALPEIPKGDAGLPETMKEYMKTVPDSSDTLPDKIKKAIKELRSPEKQVVMVADNPVPLSPKKYSEEKKKSTKPSLLERIRAKERERKRRDMLRNPEMEVKKGRLEKLSRSLLQCICSYYNLKKVGAMKFVELVDKLTFSIGSISKVEIEAVVKLLCEVCPTYFNMVEVRGEKYVQLKENNFPAIRDVINAEIAKCV